MGLLRRPAVEERLSIDDIFELFTKNGLALNPSQTWSVGGHEQIAPGLPAYVARAYGGNAIVFSVILSRTQVFSEARFQFQSMSKGRPGDLFGTPALSILETPWPNGNTADLLARMEQDASLAGNSFVRRIGNPNAPTRLERLRPDWVEIIGSDPLGNPDELGRSGAIDLIGYSYTPGGAGGSNSKRAIFLLPDEVAHYAPIPDPLSQFRGMSWLTPVVREIEGDLAMTKHKNKFFEQAATPNMLLKFQQKLTPEAFDRLRAQIETRYEGVDNAYKTMILEGGADATVVGANFQQMTFADVQAAGENRICIAAGVPGIIVGIKEGLRAATYSNFQEASRKFIDMTMRPLWRNAANSLAAIIPAPSGSRLWYDDRDIAALREDGKDRAEIARTRAITIDLLVRAGYEPDTVVPAVLAEDYALLKHTGAIPTTLYPGGADPTVSTTKAADNKANGKTPAPA